MTADTAEDQTKRCALPGHLTVTKSAGAAIATAIRPRGRAAVRGLLMLSIVLPQLLAGWRPAPRVHAEDVPAARIIVLSPCVNQRLRGDQAATVRVRVDAGPDWPAGWTLGVQVTNEAAMAPLDLPMVASDRAAGTAGPVMFTAELNTTHQHLPLGHYRLLARVRVGAREIAGTSVTFVIGVPQGLVAAALQRIPPAAQGSSSPYTSATVVTWADLTNLVENLMIEYVDPVSGTAYSTYAGAYTVNMLERVLHKPALLGDDAPYMARAAEMTRLIDALAWRSLTTYRGTASVSPQGGPVLYKVATTPAPETKNGCTSKVSQHMADASAALYGAAQAAPVQTYKQTVARAQEVTLQLASGLSYHENLGGPAGDSLEMDIGRPFEWIPLPRPGALGSAWAPVDRVRLQVRGGASISSRRDLPAEQQPNPPQNADLALLPVGANWQVQPSDWGRTAGVIALGPLAHPLYWSGSGPPNLPTTFEAPATGLLVPAAPGVTTTVAPRFVPAVVVRIAYVEPPAASVAPAGTLDLSICHWSRYILWPTLNLWYHQQFTAVTDQPAGALRIGHVRVDYSLAEGLRARLLARLREVDETLARQHPLYDAAHAALATAEAAYHTTTTTLDTSRHAVEAAATALEDIRLQRDYLEAATTLDAVSSSSNTALKEELIARKAQLARELKQRGIAKPNLSTARQAAEQARLKVAERAARAALDLLYDPYWDASGARDKAATTLDLARGTFERQARRIAPLLEERDQLTEATTHARRAGATLLAGVSIAPAGSAPGDNVAYHATWWGPHEGQALVEAAIITLTAVLARREAAVDELWQEYNLARADETARAALLPRAVWLSLMAQAGVEELDFLGKVLKNGLEKGFVVGAGKAVLDKLLDLTIEGKLPTYTLADEEHIRRTLALNSEKHANVIDVLRDSQTWKDVETQVAKRYLRDQTTKVLVNKLLTETSSGAKLLTLVATHAENAATVKDFFKASTFKTLEGLTKKAFGDALTDGIKKWGKAYVKKAISDAIEGEAWREMFLAELYRISAHRLWATARQDVIALREELARDQTLRDEMVALYDQNGGAYYHGEESCPLDPRGSYVLTLSFIGSTATEEQVFLGTRRLYPSSPLDLQGPHLYRLDTTHLDGTLDLRVQVTNLH